MYTYRANIVCIYLFKRLPEAFNGNGGISD